MNTGGPAFFTEEAGGRLGCRLCPRRCSIASGHFGGCGVRGSKGGRALFPFYGLVTALACDPIEKKPLYHFRPGSPILSVGFAGCNLHCPFCQNWHISQNTAVPGRMMSPGDIVSAALRENSSAIAYTYSEPLVHAEFVLDCMALARRHGIANVLVTNGCAAEEAAKEILSLTDAANIDLKSFSAETYAAVLGGGALSFEAVLAFIRLACALGVHVEITTLLVPGLNDSDAELDDCADFIAALPGNPDLPGGSALPQIPWHLSAYHPDYRWNAPPTEAPVLIRAAERARKKVPFVYTGNIAAGIAAGCSDGRFTDTRCPHCGAVLVRRRGYSVDTDGLAVPAAGETVYRCVQCGGQTPIVC